MPTPLTDAELMTMTGGHVSADFSRSLERKLSIARDALHEISAESQNYHHRGDDRDHAVFDAVIASANAALIASSPLEPHPPRPSQ